MKKRSSLWALLAVAAVLALAIGGRMLVWSGAEHGGGGGVGGPFALTDHAGRAVTDQTYRGRWMLIYFGYTFCPDICPTSLSTIAAALDGLAPEERAKVQPLFVTVDPERDTPAVMKDYVAAFAPDLIGLVGTPEQTEAVKKAYRVYAVKAKSDDPTAYTVDHSSIIYLMGPDGRFVPYFAHGTTSAALLAGLRERLR